MSWLRTIWLRFSIRGLELEIDELDSHARHFSAMADHKKTVLRKKRQELDNLENDRP